MAIVIPRAQTTRPMQTAVREAPIRYQEEEAGRRQVASQVDQIGQTLRRAQANADAAWANATVYSERRIAEQIAAEEGLAGQDYEQFMDSRVRRARDMAVQSIRLPEAKRAVSNNYQQAAEADQLEFAAQGRQKELNQQLEQYKTTQDTLGVAAQNQYLMQPNGEIDPQLYELADNAELNADGVPFQGEREAEERRRQSKSYVAFTAGREIILGYTRNGQGNPQRMLDILTNDDHELNKRLTEEDNFRLRQLALQRIDALDRASSSRKSAAIKRVKEMNKNIGDALDDGMPVNQNTMIELGRHLQAVQAEYPAVNFGQYQPGWELTVQDEEARQTIFDAMETSHTMSAYTAMRSQPASVVESTVAEMESQWSQMQSPVLPNKGTMDSVTMPDGTTMETGEYLERQARYKGAKMRLNELNAAENNGGLAMMYMRENTGGSPAALISVRDFNHNNVVNVDGQPQVKGLYVLNERLDQASQASEAYGRTASLWTKEEAGAFEEGIANGELDTSEILSYVDTLGEMSNVNAAVARQSMQMVSEKNRPWMMSAIYASQIGNLPAAQRIIEGRRVDPIQFFETEGVRNELETGFAKRIDMSLLGGMGSNESKDLLNGLTSLYYGAAPNKVGNPTPSTDDYEATIQSFFPNGATFDGDRFYPNPSGKGAGGQPLDATAIIDGLRPEHFDAGLLPKPAMAQDVEEEFVGMDITERMIEAIEDGEVDLVPDLSNPGVYVPVANAAQLDFQVGQDRGFLLDEKGRPLRFNFNNWYQKTLSQSGWDMQPGAMERINESLEGMSGGAL